MLAMLVGAIAACGETTRLPVSAGTGPNPTLPAPQHSLIPQVNIAPARGWPPGASPIAAQGLRVGRFAEGLDHPRWLYVLPNGDVLVAETNAPVRPDDAKGIKGWLMKMVMKRSGAGVPSANQITLLRDADGDGVAETRSVFLAGLNSPFGMALVGDDLFVANTDAIVRFSYTPDATRATQPGRKVIDLPGGPLNHHWTKNIIASDDGTRLYAAVGSNSNIAENGIEAERDRAAVWEIDLETGAHRIFASGLRNPVGLAWEPSSGILWTSVNERDEIGGDLVPDYMTGLRDGAFYGWPYSYFGQHIDSRVQPPNPELVARAIPPDFALGAHTASLGLAFWHGSSLTPRFAHGMFIGQHGSWNRKPRSGYQVVFAPFCDDKPCGELLDVLTGFVNASGEALGRPVGVTIDKRGALLVADDVGNIVWSVRGTSNGSRLAQDG